VTFQHTSSIAGAVSRNGGFGVEMVPGVSAPSDWIDFAISPEEDYLISFAVASEPGNDTMSEWPWPGHAGAYVLPGGSSNASLDTWSTAAGLETREAVLAVERIEVTFPAEGRFASRIFDTHQVGATMRTFRWEETLNGGAVEMRLRAGEQPDLVDAPGWDAASSFVGGGPSHSVPASVTGRYVQFLAILTPPAGYLETPQLRQAEVTWDPEMSVCDLVVDITGDPAGGAFEVFVDGQNPTRAVMVDLALFNEFLGVRYQERGLAEVEPRNSGR
jgi:hypothetical protein